MRRSREISKAWKVSAQRWLEPPGYLGFGKLDWIPAQVPGHIHDDLVRAGVIGDPFVGLQELGCQWVDEEVWVYESTFDHTPDDALPQRVLRFEGLDTVCIVHLNGAEIGRHDNMFVAFEVDVSELLHSGLNTLRVTFLPALIEARRRRAIYFEDQNLRPDLVRFEESAFVRKAPYMFGWDWGPRLISAGIWKPVYLIEFGSRIEHVQVRQTHLHSGGVQLVCHSRVAGEGRVVHVLRCSGDAPIVFFDAAEITLSAPKLWWPAGLGAPHLYELESFLLPTAAEGGPDDGPTGHNGESELHAGALDVRRTRIGLRVVELEREPDAWGESFRIRVNGERVFCLGANWIPDHSYPSKVTRARLTSQLDRVRDMNMNMLRVWGGGVYESDEFYELCDERGILVWQDFPFACSYSPDDDGSLAVIDVEARANLARLHHHPSLVLWCGNNENRMMFEAKWDAPDRHPERCIGELIWDQALPNLLAALDPTRPYLATSPHSPRATGALANADGVGDQHNWDVWHGRGDWRHYVESRARFASEYGFASAPTPAAWSSMCGPGWQHLSVDDAVARWHDKTKKGYETFRRLVELHYERACTLGDWTYFSQLNQRDALRTAVEHYRRSPFCAGSLIWQLNDCWPVQSWSVLDCAGGYKAAAHELRRLYAPLLVSLELVRASHEAFPTAVRIWMALHNSREPQRASVGVRLCDHRDGTVLWTKDTETRLDPGEVRLLLDIDVSSCDPTTTVVWVTLGEVVWHGLLCEPKDLQARQPHFNALRHDDGRVLLSSDSPAIDVCVRQAEDPHAAGHFLNFPTAGEQAVGLGADCTSLEVRWLGGTVTVPVTRGN